MDKGIKFLAELLVGFYLARYLGSELFGLFNFAISYVILFQGISTLGMNEVLVRELMLHQQQTPILSTALLMRIITSLILVGVLYGFAAGLDSSARVLILIISVSLVFRSFEIFTPYFQSIVKGEWVAFIQITVTIIGASLKVLCISLEKDLLWFAYIYSFEWLILGIGLFVIYWKNKKWSWKFETRWSVRLLKSSWYLLLSAAAVNLYMRVDQVMIRQMVNDSANGQYSAAVRLSEIWYIFPSILCAIFFPAILNAKKQNEQLYYQRLKFLNAFLFWLALVISVIIAPLAEPLIIYLYGEEYAPAGKILSYHIWSSIFVFFGVSSGYWLVAENLERISLYRTIVGLGVNILLNFLLIPMVGAVGAAIATLFAQSVAAVFWMLLVPAARSIIWVQMDSIIFPIRWFFINKRTVK